MSNSHGYEWEIFVSYTRRVPVQGFVRDCFKHVLEERLGLLLPQAPRIFIDENLEAGVRWPDALADAHAKSKVLIPVFIPAYFFSDWCIAELHSMLCREGHIRREARLSGQNPNLCRLVFPVLLAAVSQFPFPQYAQNRQMVNLTAFNAVPQGALRKNKAFITSVDGLATSLVNVMYPGPRFEPNWPRLCRKAPRPNYAFSPMR
jgi:hypothetical protein